MIDLIPYILILLAIGAVALIFIIRVLVKQIGLFKYTIKDKDISHFRSTLFAIALTIIVMGSVPVAINVYTLFFATNRPEQVAPISFIYSFAVHLQTLLLSYLLWRIYRLATGDFNDREE